MRIYEDLYKLTSQWTIHSAIFEAIQMARFNTHLLLLALSLTGILGSRVTLTNNGYSDILVAISPDVPKTQAQNLINNIQKLIADASPTLYQATRRRSYFKSVRILIPKSWDHIPANSTTWESFKEADVQIDFPRSRFGDRPYTLQPGGCGQPGDHIHLTPNYLLTVNDPQNAAQFGNPSKVFVTQWAHLRYGVFEEFGSPNDTNYPLFYQPQGLDVPPQPNACLNPAPHFKPEDINTGNTCVLDPQTGTYNENCTIVWHPNYQPVSSLMTHPLIESVAHFCDDGPTYTHNRLAPTKHNVLCNLQSVWSVITQHQDFSNNNNPPRNITNLTPSFIIVRPEQTRFVLVADVSGSMVNYDRIGNLNRAGRRWIQYDISDGSQLGIVIFQHNSTVSSNLTTISSTSRPILASQLPSKAEGGTCIGCGLQTALRLLENSPGGVILLLTDGMETHAPTIADVLPSLIASQARVVSIAFGTAAQDSIETLAEQTDGKSYFIDDQSSGGLSDAFTDSLTYQPALPSDSITVQLFKQDYASNSTTIVDSFAVDSTVGRNLNFRLEFRDRNYIRGAVLTSPSQVKYTNVTYDLASSMGYIQIADAEVGIWNFNVSVNPSVTNKMTISVTSLARSNTVPVTTECSAFTGPNVNNATLFPVKIIAKVTQGRNPVIGATVKAYIDKPNDAVEILNLLDNGIFADTTANDGIYSRFFVSILNLGRYSILCQVWDDGSAFIEDGFIPNYADNRNVLGQTTSRGTPTGNFTRLATGGSFIARDVVSSSDPYPPGRVVDLKVTATNVNDMTVTFKWSAPGDDLDYGKVDRYQFEYANDFESLVGDKFNSSSTWSLLPGDVVGGSLNPLEVGSIQTVTFKLPSIGQNTEFFFALRAIDDAGKSSPTSNIVSAKMIRYYTTTQSTTTPTTTTPTTTTPTTTTPTTTTPTTTTPTTTTPTTTTPTTTTPTTTTPTTTTPTTTTPTTTTLTTTTPSRNCTSDTPYPHEDICTEYYYVCMDGVAYLAICPNGSVFDPETYKCTNLAGSSCAEPTTQRPFQCPDSNGHFPASPYQCVPEYYICVDDIPYPEVCPANSVFDPVSKVCVNQQSASCNVPTSTTMSSSSSVNFDCPSRYGNFPYAPCSSYYYSCNDYIGILRTCPSGLVYNRIRDICDWPENVADC